MEGGIPRASLVREREGDGIGASTETAPRVCSLSPQLWLCWWGLLGPAESYSLGASLALQCHTVPSPGLPPRSVCRVISKASQRPAGLRRFPAQGAGSGRAWKATPPLTGSWEHRAGGVSPRLSTELWMSEWPLAKICQDTQGWARAPLCFSLLITSLLPPFQ